MLKFNLNYTYVALRTFTFNGRTYQPGEVIDKIGASPHRLKQMYELRKIRPMLPEEHVARNAPDDAEVIDDTDATDAENTPSDVSAQAEITAIPAPAPVVRRKKEAVHAHP
jgi:hypothetical protein